jgi:hypothetical protein
MTKLAAIEGQLVSIKNVSTHKSACLTIHVPEEYALKVIEAFGWPTMVAPVPVAIAKLDLNVKATATPEDDTISPQAAGGHARAAALTPERRTEIARSAAKKRWHELSLAQQAGMLCSETPFRKFLAERDPELRQSFQVLDGDMAADEVRSICGVKSRSEIDGLPEAAAKFRKLEIEYRAWMVVA